MKHKSNDERTKGLERIKKKVKETLRDTDKREKEKRKSVKDLVFLLWKRLRFA